MAKRRSKKLIGKKTKTKPGGRQSKLLLLLKNIDKLIHAIKKKNQETENKISKEQAKLIHEKDPNMRLYLYFQIEGYKINHFPYVEPEYQKMSTLLDKAFVLAAHVGGVIKDDFLNICQDLSKGINLEDLQRDCGKMIQHLHAKK